MTKSKKLFSMTVKRSQKSNMQSNNVFIFEENVTGNTKFFQTIPQRNFCLEKSEYNVQCIRVDHGR